MVKRRTPKASGSAVATSEPTAEQIEAFAAGVDGGAATISATAKTQQVDIDANRDYKAMRVPFNEYEYQQLVKGAALSGRSKLNFMRYAMLKMVRELEESGG
jgi:hypothetical protein